MRRPTPGTPHHRHHVDISNDLHFAKVFFSVIGTDKERSKPSKLSNRQPASSAVHASKKVVMRYFPALTFKLDTTADDQMKIDALIEKIRREENQRHGTS